MPQFSLTDRFVAGAKSKQLQTDFFDDHPRTRGLCLRVTSAGRKTWCMVFTSPRDGKRARISFGTYPATSLAKARTLAVEARRELEDYRDPRDVAAAQADSAMTVAGLIESYLEKHARPNLRSADEMERRLAKNITPMIGGVRLCELHRRDMNRVVDPVVARGRRIEAGRVFEDLRAIVRWAVARGDLEHNPFDGMKKPGRSMPRERVLNDNEIAKLWTELPTVLAKTPTCQRIIKLCLRTAQRVGEVSGLTIEELDLDAAVWTIPGIRTKNGHKHVVPLSVPVVELLKEALADDRENARFVFPSRDGSGPLSPLVVAKTILRARQGGEERPLGRFGLAHWTAHDLRRTAVSGMARLGVAPIVLGHIINHRSVTRAGVTLSVYTHYDYAKEKREALESWAERLSEIVRPSMP